MLRVPLPISTPMNPPLRPARSPQSYHVAPVCFACLILPFEILEARTVLAAASIPFEKRLFSACLSPHPPSLPLHPPFKTSRHRFVILFVCLTLPSLSPRPPTPPLPPPPVHPPSLPFRYHIAPVCFACLILPFGMLEAKSVLAAPSIPFGKLLISACAAFALNCSVFLLIGKTSALTMNVAGVVKDWLLIFASVLLYR